MIVLIRKKVAYLVLLILLGIIILLSLGYWKAMQEPPEATMVMSKGVTVQQEEMQNRQRTDTDIGGEQVQKKENENPKSLLNEREAVDAKTEEIRINWQKQRDKERDELRYLLEHSNHVSIQVQTEEQLLALTKEQALEEQCMQILTAKDYDNIVVMIQGESITALLGQGYRAEDGIVVAETLARCSGFPVGKIVVLLQELYESGK